ncbi:MAG: DUF2807 domain-containing protein [Proteobacteria bacterium]|nr:DUF2807 domain-containing protein [Pseudomonadota bacterium]
MILFSLACIVVEGSGVTVTESREVEDGFGALAVSSHIDVDWTSTDTSEVRVTCDDNLQDHVRVFVEDEVLHVTTEDATWIQPGGSCFVEVDAPCLFAIESSGSGDVSVDTVCGEELIVSMSGSGDIDIDQIDVDALITSQSGSGDLRIGGTCDHALVNGSGSGDLAARATTCRTAEINTSGGGDVELTVTEHAEVSTSGSGDVDLFGACEVDGSSSGSGDITSH